MVLQDGLRNRIKEQQDLVKYVWYLVTTIFLAESFLTGIFEVNVTGLPAKDKPEAFNYIAISMMVLVMVHCLP